MCTSSRLKVRKGSSCYHIEVNNKRLSVVRWRTLGKKKQPWATPDWLLYFITQNGKPNGRKQVQEDRRGTKCNPGLQSMLHMVTCSNASWQKQPISQSHRNDSMKGEEPWCRWLWMRWTWLLAPGGLNISPLMYSDRPLKYQRTVPKREQIQRAAVVWRETLWRCQGS